MYKKHVVPYTILSSKNLIHILLRTELIPALPDTVRKTLADFMLSRSVANMASQSLFLICFFRNTSLLSFHVANADGYHSRVNTQGSWDAPQQLIAQTCREGATETGFLHHRSRKEYFTGSIISLLDRRWYRPVQIARFGLRTSLLMGDQPSATSGL